MHKQILRLHRAPSRVIVLVNLVHRKCTVIDNKLSFHKNCDVIFKKCRQRMHVLYTLRAFRVNGRIIEKCYHAFVLSVLSFSMVCWFGSLSEKERKRLNGIVRVCGKIVGNNQQTLEHLYRVKSADKAAKIKSDPAHVLSLLFQVLPSGRRLRHPKCRTKRFQNTFIPQAIAFLNQRWLHGSVCWGHAARA